MRDRFAYDYNSFTTRRRKSIEPGRPGIETQGRVSALCDVANPMDGNPVSRRGSRLQKAGEVVFRSSLVDPA